MPGRRSKTPKQIHYGTTPQGVIIRFSETLVIIYCFMRRLRLSLCATGWFFRWGFPGFPTLPVGLAQSPWCFAVGVIKCFVAQNSTLELITLFINTFFSDAFCPHFTPFGFCLFTFCFCGESRYKK